MKGYDVPTGYMGWIPSLNRYVLFPCQGDYEETYRETEA